MNLIKLNPSQTVRLKKFSEEYIFTPQMSEQTKKSGTTILRTPLLCPAQNIMREDFLSIKRFSIYRIQSADDILFFPCAAEMKKGTVHTAFLCAVSLQNPEGIQGAGSNNPPFSLEEYLKKTEKLSACAPEIFRQEENFIFNATSFKMCNAEFSGSTWKCFDEVWKKVQG